MYFQVWKKEFSPCENELATLRRGEEWDPIKFQQELKEKEWRDKLEAERSRALNKVSHGSYCPRILREDMGTVSGTE